MLEDFKKFIFRGNVIDLAVAVVIGAAFSVVIDSLVSNILMPIIGIVGGKPSFDDYTITINKSVIKWGSFVTDVVNFVIIAAAIFVAIKAFERLQDMRRRGGEDVTDEPLTVEGELLTEDPRSAPRPADTRSAIEPRGPGQPGRLTAHRVCGGCRYQRFRRLARSLRSVWSGSTPSRTARHSSSRGYMAGRSSGRKRLSLAR